jgi:hypothetical protein
LVEWSQLRLFKAKEGRSYLQGSVRTLIPSSAAPHRLCRASARDHVTWNARTVTLPPPFRESSSSSFVFRNRTIDFVVSSRFALKTATILQSHMT